MDALKLTMAIQTKSFELDFDGQKQTVTWDSLNVDLNDFELVVAQGPRNLSARQEGLSTIIELGQSNPMGMAQVWDLVLEMSDTPNADKIAARYRKTLPPGILEKDNGGSGIDPEAQQALDAAQQATQQLEQNLDLSNQIIEQQTQAINELRLKLEDKEKEREARIVEQTIQTQGDLEEAEIKAENALDVQVLKNSGEVEKAVAQGGATNEGKIIDLASAGMQAVKTEAQPMEAKTVEMEVKTEDLEPTEE